MKESAKEYQIQGRTMMGLKKYSIAKEYFLKALKEEPHNELYYDLGNATASMGEYNEAINAFQEILKTDPNNGEILFCVGNAYLLKGDIKRTIEYYNQAEECGCRETMLYVNMAKTYSGLGDSQMVVRNYTKAIDNAPMQSQLYIEKAKALIDMGQYQGALNTLDSLRKLLPESFEAYDLTAKIYQKMGRNEDAKAILKKGIEKFPNDNALKLSLIQFYILVGDYNCAQEIIDEVKSKGQVTEGRRAFVLQEVAIASVQNDLERVEVLLKEVLELETDGEVDEEARYLLMTLYASKGEYGKALELAEVLEDGKTDTIFTMSALYYKAELLHKLNRTEEANVQFKKAARKLRDFSVQGKTSYECYVLRLLCHKALEEYDKAIELGEFLLQLTPDAAEVNALMAEIYNALDDEENYKKYAIK